MDSKIVVKIIHLILIINNYIVLSRRMSFIHILGRKVEFSIETSEFIWASSCSYIHGVKLHLSFLNAFFAVDWEKQSDGAIGNLIPLYSFITMNLFVIADRGTLGVSTRAKAISVPQTVSFNNNIITNCPDRLTTHSSCVFRTFRVSLMKNSAVKTLYSRQVRSRPGGKSCPLRFSSVRRIISVLFVRAKKRKVAILLMIVVTDAKTKSWTPRPVENCDVDRQTRKIALYTVLLFIWFCTPRRRAIFSQIYSKQISNVSVSL